MICLYKNWRKKNTKTNIIFSFSYYKYFFSLFCLLLLYSSNSCYGVSPALFSFLFCSIFFSCVYMLKAKQKWEREKKLKKIMFFFHWLIALHHSASTVLYFRKWIFSFLAFCCIQFEKSHSKFALLLNTIRWNCEQWMLFINNFFFRKSSYLVWLEDVEITIKKREKNRITE